MAKLIDSPSIIESVGTKPKVIREYIGKVNSDTEKLSIAHMSSPRGWSEPGQKPEFHEYTLVMKGELTVHTKHEIFNVKPGQAIITYPGEWVKYDTNKSDTDYIAVCLPAFCVNAVHRDEH